MAPGHGPGSAEAGGPHQLGESGSILPGRLAARFRVRRLDSQAVEADHGPGSAEIRECTRDLHYQSYNRQQNYSY